MHYLTPPVFLFFFINKISLLYRKINRQNKQKPSLSREGFCL
nr:MAG TPA: hypothetical protein [Caudoviricetes sp.]